MKYNAILEEIYDNFTKIQALKSYYSKNRIKEYIAFLLVMLGVIFSIIFIFVNSVYKNEKYIVLFLIVPLVLIILGLKMIDSINKGISRDIKKEFNIKYDYKSVSTYFSIARSNEFVKYLDSIGVKSIGQKELLAKLLYEKYEETKIKSFWVASAFVALILPIWNKIIDMELPKHVKNPDSLFSYLSVIIITISLIIMVSALIKVTIHDNFIEIINIKK